MDIGETFRLAREQRGLSLETLTQRTKISAASLRAIEANDIERLPRGIFLRGFLRAYAREVGLDVEDTVARYIAQFESQDAAAEGPVEPGFDEPVTQHSATEWMEESAREVSVLGVIAIVVLAAGLLTYITLRQPPTTVQIAAAPPQTTQVSPPSTNAVLPPSAPPAGGSASTFEQAGTAGSQQPAATSSSAEDAKTVDLTMQAEGPCWVSAVVDGSTVVYRLLQAGEHVAIDDGSEIVLRVGDPSVLTVRINGATTRSLGRPAVATTVHITAANYEDFIAASP